MRERAQGGQASRWVLCRAVGAAASRKAVSIGETNGGFSCFLNYFDTATSRFETFSSSSWNVSRDKSKRGEHEAGANLFFAINKRMPSLATSLAQPFGNRTWRRDFFPRGARLHDPLAGEGRYFSIYARDWRCSRGEEEALLTADRLHAKGRLVLLDKFPSSDILFCPSSPPRRRPLHALDSIFSNLSGRETMSRLLTSDHKSSRVLH